MREEVRRPEFFRYMAEPWLGLKPVEPKLWPDVWQPNRYAMTVNLFGWLKMGTQIFEFSEPAMPEGQYAFRCKSQGAWINLWDHWIILKGTGEGQTRYRDKVNARAGILRPVLSGYAAMYTAHHQERLRALVASGFNYPAYERAQPASRHRHDSQYEPSQQVQG